MDTAGASSGWVSGTRIKVSISDARTSRLVTTSTLAPRVITSFRLLTDLSTSAGSVMVPMTVVPFSIRAMGPCFSSPLGYASEWI